MLNLLNRPRPILTEDECAEVGYVTADCPQCRADADLPQREHAARTWYYCRACGAEWRETPPERDWPMIISSLATLAIILTIVLTSVLVCATYAVDHHWSRDGLTGATLLGFPIGIAIVVALSSAFHLLNRVTYAAYDYVWGPPLSWFATVPRRPRA